MREQPPPFFFVEQRTERVSVVDFQHGLLDFRADFRFS